MLPSLNASPFGDEIVVVTTWEFMTVLWAAMTTCVSFSSPYDDCEIRLSVNTFPVESYIGI